MSKRLSDEAIRQLVQQDMQATEALMRAEMQSEVPLAELNGDSQIRKSKYKYRLSRWFFLPSSIWRQQRLSIN